MKARAASGAREPAGRTRKVPQDYYTGNILRAPLYIGRDPGILRRVIYRPRSAPCRAVETAAGWAGVGLPCNRLLCRGGVPQEIIFRAIYFSAKLYVMEYPPGLDRVIFRALYFWACWPELYSVQYNFLELYSM